jgi:hypothetical protein
MEKFTFTLALSTPQTSVSSSSVNFLPFLECSFNGFLLNTVIFIDGSFVQVKLALQAFEVYEVSPTPLGKNCSIQKISSAASFGLPYVYSQHFSQDGSELEKTSSSPCPSIMDAIGANDIRNGFKYSRLISRRIDKDNFLMPKKNSKSEESGNIFGNRTSGKSSKNQFSYSSLKGNLYGSREKSNSKFDFNNGTSNTETPLSPLVYFELELRPKKEIKRVGKRREKGENSSAKEKEVVKEIDKEEEKEEEGHCGFNMEELEILFCPSAQWVAALGTFLVLSPIPENR